MRPPTAGAISTSSCDSLPYRTYNGRRDTDHPQERRSAQAALPPQGPMTLYLSLTSMCHMVKRKMGLSANLDPFSMGRTV